jgi:hypothetical protein
MASLQDYLTDTAALLHDMSFSFHSQSQLTRWVNEARRIVALDTSCVRRLITGESLSGAQSQPGSFIPGSAQPGALPNQTNAPSISGTPPFITSAANPAVSTINNVERYPFKGFWNSAARDEHSGVLGVYDASALIINWGGAVRVTADWYPVDELQAYCRAFLPAASSFPFIWSIYNDGPDGEIWIWPVPSEPLTMQLDAYCLPAPIYSDSDPDVIPDGMSDAVKFKAASIALMAARRYMEAELLEARYQERAVLNAAARDSGKTRSYYYFKY